MTNFGFKDDLMEYTFVDDVQVTLIDHMAADRMVIRAAKVSTQGAQVDDSPEGNYGFINFLIKNRHSSPFEHNSFTWRISAPIFVWREFMRHRVGVSYNEESGRYKQLDPVFYIPGEDRNLTQVGKPGHYVYEPGSSEQRSLTDMILKNTCITAYNGYLDLLDAGVAREVARMALPLNIVSTVYVTMNARSLMHFLSLRVKDETSLFPSYPMREIEMTAQKMEKDFSELMPLTHQAFVDNGRA